MLILDKSDEALKELCSTTPELITISGAIDVEIQLDSFSRDNQMKIAGIIKSELIERLHRTKDTIDSAITELEGIN